jgi:hypothetical protein
MTPENLRLRRLASQRYITSCRPRRNYRARSRFHLATIARVIHGGGEHTNMTHYSTGSAQSGIPVANMNTQDIQYMCTCIPCPFVL